MSAELDTYDTALRLAERGYHVIPVHPRTKAAIPKDWPQLRLSAADIPNYFNKETVLSLGVLTGTRVADDCFIYAFDIDVDDPDLIRRVALAFPETPPSKVGRKGRTYFMQAPHEMKKRNLTRKDAATGMKINMIELLATGQQTVIPPSQHKDGMYYQWIGTPLTEIDPKSLPLLTASVLAEVTIAVTNPASPLLQLNDMTWRGVGGGGDTHDICVAAVASMVSYGWADDAIVARVLRAKQRVVEEAGDVFDWPEGERTIAEWIKSAREKGFAEKPPKAKKEKPHRVVAEWFMKNYASEGNVYNRDGRIAMYRDGAFDIWETSEIRHLLATKYLEPDWMSLNSADWNIVVHNVLDLTPRFPEAAPKRRVCFVNGTYDMDSGNFGEHDRDDFLISRLPINYDPEAICPVYDRFMRETFAGLKGDNGEKSISVYEEFVAHTMFECLDFHKFLVVKGQPRTGKSTLMKIARMLHGRNAVSTVPVQEFGNERYRTAMVGKLLNIVSEVQATSHAADDFLKAVTAGDEVSVRYLYEEPLDVQLPARILIACNEMFRTRDASGAIEARMLMVPCDNVVPEEERDVELLDKLRAELPGIFNRMAKAWVRLKRRKRFDPPEVSATMIRDFSLENNHAVQWMQERTLQGQALIDPEKTIIDPTWPETELGMLYLDYAEWAKLNGFKGISSVTFGMRLTNIKADGLDLSPHVKWIGGKACRTRALTLTNGGKY